MSELTNIEDVIRGYLPDIIHMSLGTCAGDKPWVCEVHFVYDAELNIYFRSLASRRHSQEISANPNVAGNMVVQHNKTDKPRGVYFEGMATQLEDVKKTDDAYQLYRERFGTGPEILEEDARDEGHKFYKITVENYYLFDSRDSKPSQKYSLSWGK